MNSNIIICNSGGAQGSDSVFGNECLKRNIQVIDWSFEGHNTKSKSIKILTKEELEEGFEHIKVANKTLKRNIYRLSPYVKNLLSRNWYQVLNSEAIFAVGNLTEDLKFVEGGTGWCVQAAIDNRKPTYVFEQNLNFWFKYSYVFHRFIQMHTDPKLTKTFAGVGTREINENGINAINRLFNNNFPS